MPTNRPAPYEGKEPYLFVSYAHRDEKLVLPYIQALNDAGYRVWYDQGIHSGTSDFFDVIVPRLKHCTAMLVFLSDRFCESENCKDELELARNQLPKNRIHLLLLHPISPGREPNILQLGFARAQRTMLKGMSVEDAVADIGKGEAMADCRGTLRAGNTARSVSKAPSLITKGSGQLGKLFSENSRKTQASSRAMQSQRQKLLAASGSKELLPPYRMDTMEKFQLGVLIATYIIPLLVIAVRLMFDEISESAATFLTLMLVGDYFANGYGSIKAMDFLEDLLKPPLVNRMKNRERAEKLAEILGFVPAALWSVPLVFMLIAGIFESCAAS